MNIKEFAKLCGVSVATASRYFSGAAGLSPQLAAKIEAVAKTTGYSPAPAYQRRKPGGNGIIAAISPYWQQHFQLDLLQALHQSCEDAGKTLVILQDAPAALPRLLPKLKSLNPEGVVLLHEGSDETFYKHLSAGRIPMVMCSGLSFTRRVPAVHIDDLAAAYDGMNYLLQLGHTQIALVSDRATAISSGSQRIMGCQKAMADAGLPLPGEHIVYAGNTFQHGYSAMQSLLVKKLPITAVFAFNDDMAEGAMAAILDHGMQVPRDISVLGFDGSSHSAHLRPALSTVAQPIQEIARRSIASLLARNKNDAASVAVAHTLLQRSSCARL